jgi:cold shock CspA family protein
MATPRVRMGVEWWSDEGWGALAADGDTRGGVFVHFSAIQANGYRTLRVPIPVGRVRSAPFDAE